VLPALSSARLRGTNDLETELQIPPGDVKADARRKNKTFVIPGLTRNPES
jgi:hypothetical protein